MVLLRLVGYLQLVTESKNGLFSREGRVSEQYLLPVSTVLGSPKRVEIRLELFILGYTKGVNGKYHIVHQFIVLPYNLRVLS